MTLDLVNKQNDSTFFCKKKLVRSVAKTLKKTTYNRSLVSLLTYLIENKKHKGFVVYGERKWVYCRLVEIFPVDGFFVE